MGQSTGRRTRSVWKLLAIGGAMAVMLAMVPASGDHLASDDGSPGILRLHVGTDAKFFRYEPTSGPAVSQPLPEPVRCELRGVNGPLASLQGNRNGAGLNGISIGVKSGGAQGVPCGRVDSTENLTVGLVGVPLAESAELDLELKGGPRVAIEVYLDGTKTETFQVRAGSGVVPGEGAPGSGSEPFTATVSTDQPIANCLGQADAGPDAGSRDNCRVTVHPELPFDAIKLVPLTGEVSLEGSGDFGDNPAHDTIFHLTNFEGTIACGGTAQDEDGPVEVVVTRHDNWQGAGCEPKAYSLVANASDPDENGDQTVTFDVATDGQAAFYEAELTLTGTLSTPTELRLQYDPEPPYDGGYQDMLACDEDPFLGGSPNVGAFQGGETACVISVFQDWEGTTRWHIVFIADIKFR